MIEGHEDMGDSAQYAQRISERRARAVADYLVTSGVSGSAISTVGYGYSRLLQPGVRTPANRRAVAVFELDPPPQ